MNSRTKKITTIGMMCAMAMVMNLLLHFPIIPAVSFLNYDPKDIVIVIASFIYGPFSAFVMSAICAVLDVMLRGGTILDILMNMIATCMFSCVAGAIYKKEHTKKRCFDWTRYRCHLNNYQHAFMELHHYTNLFWDFKRSR